MEGRLHLPPAALVRMHLGLCMLLGCRRGVTGCVRIWLGCQQLGYVGQEDPLRMVRLLRRGCRRCWGAWACRRGACLSGTMRAPAELHLRREIVQSAGSNGSDRGVRSKCAVALLTRMRPSRGCCADPGVTEWQHHRCYVNGVATSLRVLRELGVALVDFNGQHAAQSLRHVIPPKSHLLVWMLALALVPHPQSMW